MTCNYDENEPTLHDSSCRAPSADHVNSPPPELLLLPPVNEIERETREDSHNRDKPSSPPTTPWTGRLLHRAMVLEAEVDKSVNPQGRGEKFSRTFDTMSKRRA